jgi:alpha-tubulin suppressor-like RCC1 family protein
MIDSSLKRSEQTKKVTLKVDDTETQDKCKRLPKPKRVRKVLITGLNQVGLCEETGVHEPCEVPWDESFDRPIDVVAGRGTSFIITKRGHLYSFGNGRYGVLGHGDSESYVLPRRVMTLERKFVLKIGVGAFHAVALADDHVFYAWGRNHKGQLGIGKESNEELHPTAVSFPPQAAKADLIDISCGIEHSIALLRVKTRVSEGETIAYGWGDESRGQLGSGDKEYRYRPQENRYLTKLCRTNTLKIKAVVAGGYHNLVLLDQSGQVIAWGAGDYGQLGTGYQFDTNEPQIINGLDRVMSLSAGMRHSMAVCDRQTIDVMAWGYNGYGELGLSDANIRLHPTKISAIKNSNVLQVSCGDRHSAIVTSHHPVKAHELPALKPYFQILEVCFRNKLVLLAC